MSDIDTTTGTTTGTVTSDVTGLRRRIDHHAQLTESAMFNTDRYPIQVVTYSSHCLHRNNLLDTLNFATFMKPFIYFVLAPFRTLRTHTMY